jgi:uncharacterized protein
MRIDLTNIPPEGKKLNFKFSQDWWKQDFKKDRIVGMASPVSGWIKIQPMGERISVEGSLSTRLSLKCDRCLELYAWELSNDFRVFLSLAPLTGGLDIELSEDDLNLEFIHGNLLELDDIIKEQVILSLPMKTLCSGECRGLCPTCGCNLNLATCSCSSKFETPLYQQQ